MTKSQKYPNRSNIAVIVGNLVLLCTRNKKNKYTSINYLEQPYLNKKASKFTIT